MVSELFHSLAPRGDVPATLLAHQALVLPLKMRWPRRFSGLALCFGSMAPDLEFVARMTDDWRYSHTLAAQAWFTVPLTLVLVLLFTHLLVPTLLPYLREIPALRLHDLAALVPPRDARGWASVAVSGWIGGMSHVVLDGITHGNHSGWLVPLFPALRTPVPHFGSRVPLHDALQCWLTVLFALASLWLWRTIARDRLLWRWRAGTACEPARRPRASGMSLLLLCGIAAMQGGLVGRTLHAGARGKALGASIAFGAIDSVVVALLLTAVSLHFIRRQTLRLPERLETA
jgi:hypothetical protein